MLRHLPESALDQMYAMKFMLLGGIASCLAAADIPLALMFDPFSAEPLTGNTAFFAMVAGSLGGAFISTQRRNTSRNSAQWSRRMALATVCGVLFTPIALNIASKLDIKVFGIAVTIVPNAAVVLSGSATMALCAKEVIRYIQDKFLVGDD